MKKYHTEDDLIGTWLSPDPLEGYQCFVTITFDTNHVLSYLFQNGNNTSELQNTWQYDNGVLTEETGYGAVLKGSLQWMSDDYFILTILENGSPQYKGAKRHYKRVIKKI